jgi:hypothetical protein
VSKAGIRYCRVEKSGSQLEKELKMTRQLGRNLYGTTDLNRENAFGGRQAQPAKPSYTWKEIFGDAGDGDPTPNQACEVNPAQFQTPEVDADEFESVYLWFLA